MYFSSFLSDFYFFFLLVPSSLPLRLLSPLPFPSLPLPLAPEISVSTNPTVRTPTDYGAGLVSISCTPTIPTAAIYWTTLDGGPLWEDYPDFSFEPAGLNHTVTLYTAPQGIAVFYCGVRVAALYDQIDYINEQSLTVVSVTRMLWL